MGYPSYLKLLERGKIKKIAEKLYQQYESCELCPRKCGVNRNKGETGVCGAGSRVKISSAHPHMGEERPLVGRYGSGTIFLSHCNLLCLYCQNWDISHRAEGDEISDQQLAGLMLRMQKIGCHNINFVTPTHYLPNIAAATQLAAEKGLGVPIVYNTGGYDNIEMLKLLDGMVDIYLPDFKYADEAIAGKFSQGVNDYPRVAKEGLIEMHRQVGVLNTDENDVAVRGLMIRHLVLPNNLAGTEELVRFVAEELDPNTYLNIMPQYRPCYQASNHPELARSLTMQEFRTAIDLAQKHGLTNLDKR